MMAEFVNHLWQSSCFALSTGLLAFALRKSPPKVRYWLWLSASLKFLAPVALLVSLGSLVPRPVPRVAAVADVAPVLQVMEPFTPALYSTVPAKARASWTPVMIGIVWALGFLAITWSRSRSWFRIRAALRAGTPIQLPVPIAAVVAPGVAEPGVVGFLRPVLMLPQGLLERLDARQLHAILSHEMCHVRRRDNLFAAIHMVVETIFWFDPLVWWIGSRMVEERERACDEEVLRTGCEPADYVEGILQVCRFYEESPSSCMAGVTGADIKKRLRAILAGSIAREWSLGKKVALAAAGVASLVAPVVIGVLNAHAATLKFEVASIRPCEPGHGPVSISITPGMFKAHCFSVRGLIGTAYVINAAPGNGTVFLRDGITGGPAWLNSDQYDIEAKAEGNPGGPVMAGPMLRALLEERFGLRLHSGTKEIPLYELTVARSGFKLKALPKGSCTPVDPYAPDPQGLTQDEARAAAAQHCYQALGANGSGQLNLHAATLDQMAAFLSGRLAIDRPVVNRTGIAGIFDFHLEFTPNENTPHVGFLGAGGEPPAPGEPADPSIFAALQQQLGLKLQPAKGPGEFLVIDHVDRPSEN
jgi:bla regulator protein BlaR1